MRPTLVLCCVGILAAGAATAAPHIYTFLDADGVKHFTDIPDDARYRMLILSHRHLETVIREYTAHYNEERPHRSRALRPPASRGDPPPQPGNTINRDERLGGLLASYSVAA